MLEALNLDQFFQLIPNEETARLYIETKRWNNTPTCVECGGTNVAECKHHKPQPYRCRDCRKHFSVRGGIMLAGSRTGLQKWLQAIYILTVCRQGMTSDQLAFALDIDERTARTLVQLIHDCLLANQKYKHCSAPRRTRRHALIEPINAGFDEIVGMLVTMSWPPSAATPIDEVAQGQFERAKRVLRGVFRVLFAAQLRVWEETLPVLLWDEFRSLTQWRDNEQICPSWWDELVAELLYETLDGSLVRYLLAVKPTNTLPATTQNKR
ncbi:MAG: transposase [Pseudomonadales bacterium]|nr:transposase [Pseudomonadales bacterium]